MIARWARQYPRISTLDRSNCGADYSKRGARAASLVVIAPLAHTVATGNATINRKIGPVDAAASPSTLVGLALCIALLLLCVRIAILLLQARLTRACERTERGRLLAGYFGADWATQATEPPGRLQTVTSFTSIYADRVRVDAQRDTGSANNGHAPVWGNTDRTAGGSAYRDCWLHHVRMLPAARSSCSPCRRTPRR